MKRRLALLSSTILLCVLGCGTPGAPKPPSLYLPKRIEDLKAVRVGDKVYLSWTAPERTTDEEGIKSAGKVEICRALTTTEPVTCRDKAGEVTLPPLNSTADRKQTFIDDISSIVNNPRDFVVYNLLARNDRGKSAGPSNPVAVFLAPADAPVQDLKATVERDAVRLDWTPPAAVPESRMRIERHRVVLRKGEGGTVLFNVPEAANFFRDTFYDWDKTYDYVVQGVTRVLSQDGSKVLVEFTGEPSQPVTVTPRDVFPPGAPEAVEAVYSNGFIDLTWRPVNESDIVGYNIYRTLPNGQPQKLDTEPVVSSAFRDDKLQGIAPGTQIRYTVTAIDGRGNESVPSQPATEMIPQP
jgi:hypothetical protein